MTEERLVVEVVAAHNLMPKDGQGSSSSFVEVEFEHQRQRTSVKHKDLNPVWNERLVFAVSDPADLPYRAIDVGVYNERSSASSRNFLGRVRISAAGVPAPGEEPVPQLFSLEKRSLFSHIRGEISLKIYRGHANDIREAGGNQTVAKVKEVAPELHPSGRKQQQHQQPPVGGQVRHQHQQQAKPQQQQQQQQQQQRQNNQGQMQHPQQGKQHQPMGPAFPVDFKPVVLTAGPPVRPELYPAGVGAGMGAPFPGANTHPRQEFSLKETRPHLGGGAANRDKTSSTYDLVEQIQYLYVRVVRARGLPIGAGAGAHVEVKLGNYRGFTRGCPSLHWDQVFAFAKDCIQSTAVEIFVKEKEGLDDFIGWVAFDMGEVPRRAPPDSPLAPQWYRLDDRKGEKLPGEVMLSVWFGTQADESFSEAWHSTAAGVQGDGLSSIKSKVYLSPKLWYLRVSVLEAQDLLPGEKGAAAMGRYPELFVRAQVGNQSVWTRPARVSPNRSPSNPVWNEDLMFVVAEPFEDYLAVFVEDRLGPGREEPLGRVLLPVAGVDQRLGDKAIPSRWFGLEGAHGDRGGRFASRLHLRLSLDGGYHVLDEATMHSSDLRATAKQLWDPCIGVLEMGILGASGLLPMKTRDGKGGTADAYCVAKYGPKWIRTRTVVDSLCPRWNEQYKWEVFDACTVVTIGVFDNCHLDGKGLASPAAGLRDNRIGKVRIRLSTLESDRVYTHAYPLLMLHPSGVKKMGELHLAIRFSCANTANMLHLYLRPPLPKMHYVEPIPVQKVEHLRYRATEVVASRLSRAEPRLGREVVEYMLDKGSNFWSMRRSKANFFRLIAVFAYPIAVVRWVEAMRSWQRPVQSVLFVAAHLLLMLFPEVILPFLFCSLAGAGLWHYRRRPRHPPSMDIRLSQAESVHPDELDEEFDTFPTSLRSLELMSVRYDRLRSVAMRLQSMMGDVATQCERCQSLLGWRDPRATVLFLGFCLAAAALFYAVPARVVLGLWWLHAMMPPRVRSRLPSPMMNFFKRLPSKADSLL
ncbi:hypothetical protein Taro_013774 [Colocasia esculenta]|uniref:C2 domain-containing protein n=1 Tax=Colocasia esculenta TaxID=4460 RepID=A0A843UCM5_COLES|nr:hypothetical protein [Colocasia esculenta]